MVNIIKGVFRYLFDGNYRFLFNASRGLYDNLDDETYLGKLYKARFGRPLNLENPKGFNEKLQWLKLYNRNPEYTMMADKYRVREYIKNKLGENFLIPLLGVWDKPEDIDFDALPNQFVLKCNHNSGVGMYICKDKSAMNIPAIRAGLKQGLEEDYFLHHREWPYKNIKRKIIGEAFMEEEDGSELKDYKIHCFNGEPKFILVCSDRFTKDGLKEDFYDTEWNLMDLHRPNHLNSTAGIKRPEKLLEMLEYARILAHDMPFVRIDFYVINAAIYFGEITFFPASGFEPFVPEGSDEKLGEMLVLGEKKYICE